MQKEKKDKHFIHKPSYPGGKEALSKFVGDNLKYPQEALDKDIEGTVRIKYTINHKGDVIDTRVLHGLGHGCDEEAERVVRLLKFKVPRNRKIKVQFFKNIHVHFKLPRKTKQSTSVSYHYTTETEQDKPAESTGYTYSITISNS